MDAERSYAREQMITFLIAGHETSSGFLSFTMYYLLKHPEAYAKLRAEIDAVVGPDGHVKPDHLSKLPYLQGARLCSLNLASHAAQP